MVLLIIWGFSNRCFLEEEEEDFEDDDDDDDLIVFLWVDFPLCFTLLKLLENNLANNAHLISFVG